MRKQTASSRLEVKKQLDSSKIDNAMLKFEQYERRIEGLEAEVESYDLGGKKSSLEEEFAALKPKILSAPSWKLEGQGERR